MQVSDRVWRSVLYVAAAVALGFGMVEAINEAKLGTALSAGTPPPAFSALRADDGRPFALTELKGKVTVLSFWASWCGPCRRELPVLQKLEAQYRDQGLALVTVNVDEPGSREDAAAFLRELGRPPPLVVFPSENTQADWRAGTLPTLYVLGRDGQILLGHSGALPEDALRREIRGGAQGSLSLARISSSSRRASRSFSRLSARLASMRASSEMTRNVLSHIGNSTLRALTASKAPMPAISFRTSSSPRSVSR
ncbi:MAG: TlpA disulfide reductase family protein [Myxococcales bacterium]